MVRRWRSFFAKKYLSSIFVFSSTVLGPVLSRMKMFVHLEHLDMVCVPFAMKPGDPHLEKWWERAGGALLSPSTSEPLKTLMFRRDICPASLSQGHP